MPSAKGGGFNCLALLSRDYRCLLQTTPLAITGVFIAEQLDHFSLCLPMPRAVVFYLPTYPPHLNSVEVQWRKLKYEWLRAEDYADVPMLHYRILLALKAVGTSLPINFSLY